MRALVTGATGFIGGALSARLVEAGWDVSVLVRAGSLQKLSHQERFTVLQGDLAHEVPELEKWMEGCDVVFHAAAIRNRWGTTLEQYHRVNVEGTRQLVEAACGRAGRFVYISSVGVFGKPGALGVTEDFRVSPADGKAGYHTSKAAAEDLVMAMAPYIEVTSVRPTITYGPGDRDGMVPRLVSMLAKKRFIQVGKGCNHLHLTFIDDLVEGILLAGLHRMAPGEIFILAGQSSIALQDLLQLIHSLLGREQRRLYVPEVAVQGMAYLLETFYRYGAVGGIPAFQLAPPITRDQIDTLCAHRGFSAWKAVNMLGFQPVVGYEEGLKQTMKWMSGAGLIETPHDRLHIPGDQ